MLKFNYNPKRMQGVRTDMPSGRGAISGRRKKVTKTGNVTSTGTKAGTTGTASGLQNLTPGQKEKIIGGMTKPTADSSGRGGAGASLSGTTASGRSTVSGGTAGGVGGATGSWLKKLETPITAEIGLSGDERQGIYNLARGQTQGATKTAMEQARSAMGGRGFRGGESGIADSALGQIAQQGQSSLNRFSQDIAHREAANRFSQNMALNQANLSRLGTGAQTALGYDKLQQEAAARAAAQGLASNRMKWDKYKFKKQFEYGQERDAMGDLFNLFNAYRGSYGQQQGIYASGRMGGI
jgi:hypothetical protein